MRWLLPGDGFAFKNYTSSALSAQVPNILVACLMTCGNFHVFIGDRSMRLLLVALAALVLSSSAHAGEIIWRSPTTGTLKFVSPPPELEIPDPATPVDFGISYGSTRVRAGTSLYTSPIWSSGGLKTGYSFSSADLPSTLSLDLSAGLIRGRISVTGTYDFSVTISDGAGRSQTVPVAIIVE